MSQTTTIPTKHMWNGRHAATVHWPPEYRTHPNDGTRLFVVALPTSLHEPDPITPDMGIFDPSGDLWSVVSAEYQNGYGTGDGYAHARWANLKVERAH